MTGRGRVTLRIGLFILVALSVASLAGGLRNALRPEGSQDNQWGPSRALLHHQNPYRLRLEYHEHPEQPKPFILSQDPCYPVSGLILLWPYAMFPWPTAKVLWAISNLVFTAVIVAGLVHLFLPCRPKWIVVVIASMFVISTPWRVQIGNGQHALFSLAFFVLSLMFIEKDRRILSGICLAVSLFKYTVTVPLLPIFFVKRRSGVVLLAIGIHVGLTLFAAAWIHESPWSLLVDPVRVAFLVTAGQGYVDVRAILGQLGLTFWNNLWMLVAVSILVVAALICWRYGRGRELLALSLLAIVSLVVCFHLSYDAVVLVFPLVYVLRHEHNKPVGAPLSTLFALCICLSWFLEKDMFVLNTKASSLTIQQLYSGYHWFVVVLFYGTLTYGLYSLHVKWRAEATNPRMPGRAGRW